MANWDDWKSVLAQARLESSPAELHGALVGYLCGGWAGPAPELLAALELEPGSGGSREPLLALLDEAAADIHGQLGRGAGIDPLLPAGSVVACANAMVDWCRGFLGGLGLTGLLDRHRRDAGVEELLRDLAQIAAAPLEGSEADEASLHEVLDFIRAGVAQLRAAVAPPTRQ